MQGRQIVDILYISAVVLNTFFDVILGSSGPINVADKTA
jgi:hypothetical protein